MGTWGIGIFQNDISDEVCYDYKAKLKLGTSDELALQEIIAENTRYINDEEDKFDFWFALADLLFDLGRLTDDVRNKAIKLIDDGGDLKRGYDSSNLKKRKIVLEKLKEKLLSEQPSRKKISVAKPFICPWKPNDVFVYQLNSDVYKETEYYGKYVIILVHEIVNHDVEIPNLGDMLPVTFLKYSDKHPENNDDIEKAPYLLNYNHYRNGREFRFMWYKKHFKKIVRQFEYVTSYNFTRPDNVADCPKNEKTSHFYAQLGAFWQRLNEFILKRI